MTPQTMNQLNFPSLLPACRIRSARSRRQAAAGAAFSFLFAFLFVFLMTSGARAQDPGEASIVFGDLRQEYDGSAKLPSVTTDPPGLEVALRISPRREAATVFQSIPDPLPPSLASYRTEGNIDNGLGDIVDLGGSNRRLASIEVVMVNWARAADWPDLAAANPDGYPHEISIGIYQSVAGGLFVLAEQTREFLIPWRPAELDGGGDYPFNGIAFTADFHFQEDVTLSGEVGMVVSFNTQNSGANPLGVPGPYNSLNIGLGDDLPTVGSDVDRERVIRLTDAFYRSISFGESAPLFRLRAFPPEPPTGTAVDAGHYLVRATVTSEGFTGEGAADFEITPRPIDLILQGLSQPADGTPGEVSLTTDPPDLPFSVVYGGGEGPPVERGLYPVFVSLEPGNYVGSRSALMRLGYSFSSWIAEKVAGGGIPATLDGPDDDPDRDGLTNFEEYSAASDPGAPTEGAPALLRWQGPPSARVLSFRRHNDATDLAYHLESTLNLEDPGSWSDRGELPSRDDPRPDLEVIEIPIEPEVGPSRFFRLRTRAIPAIDP